MAWVLEPAEAAQPYVRDPLAAGRLLYRIDADAEQRCDFLGREQLALGLLGCRPWFDHARASLSCGVWTLWASVFVAGSSVPQRPRGLQSPRHAPLSGLG